MPPFLHMPATCFFPGRGHRIRAVTGPCQNRSPHRKRPALEALMLCSAVALCLTLSLGAATGAVGGSLIDFDSRGVRAGQLAAQVMDGTIGTGSPIEIRTSGIPTFDWRALKRWGISESRLPPSSVVQFRQVSMWEQYRWYIIVAFAIIAIQAAMIAALLLHRARRRRVEAELRESRELMGMATDAGGLGLWARDLEQDDMWANAALRSIFGFSQNGSLQLNDLLARVHPDDSARVVSEVQRSRDAQLPFEGEFRILLPAGKERWVLAKGRTVNSSSGRGARRMGVVMDITERKQIDESLRESEERFRMIADTAPVMIWMSNVDKLCTFFNKTWLDFTGRTLEQEIGNGWVDGVHREDFDRCLEIYAKAFDARQEFTMEYRLRRFDGEYRLILDNGAPRFGPGGAFLGYVGSCIDITERKRGEEEFRLVVEAAPNAMVIVNGEGRITLVNAQTEVLFGYTRPELIGQSIDMLVPERFRSQHVGDRRAYFANAKPRSMGMSPELHGRRKDGSEIPVEISLSPIEAAEGLSVLASISDISEHKRAEETLEQERAFLRQVIDVAPNFIFAKDREGRFTLVNQAVADAYGTTVEGLIGKTDADFNPNREEVEFFHRMDLEVIDTLQERFIPEERITDAQGKVRWLQTVKRPIVEKDGSVNQVLGASTDITKRKETDSELQHQREELAHVTRISTMGELAASLAHELNQPLTAILSNAQAAQRFLTAKPADLEEIKDILKDIVEDNGRASEVIRRIRVLVKKEDLAFGPLDLEGVISDVVLLVHSDAVLRNVRVSLEFSPGLPPVRGDKVQLQQVVLNLLLNAFDAMKECPADERQVLVRVDSDGNGMVEASVRDRGTGLTSDKLDKIFQPFFTTKRDGLGMGLSISRSIVEAHGGRLWAENNQDRGATFYFTVRVEGGEGRRE